MNKYILMKICSSSDLNKKTIFAKWIGFDECGGLSDGSNFRGDETVNFTLFGDTTPTSRSDTSKSTIIVRIFPEGTRILRPTAVPVENTKPKYYNYRFRNRLFRLECNSEALSKSLQQTILKISSGAKKDNPYRMLNTLP